MIAYSVYVEISVSDRREKQSINQFPIDNHVIKQYPLAVLKFITKRQQHNFCQKIKLLRDFYCSQILRGFCCFNLTKHYIETHIRNIEKRIIPSTEKHLLITCFSGWSTEYDLYVIYSICIRLALRVPGMIFIVTRLLRIVLF